MNNKKIIFRKNIAKIPQFKLKHSYNSIIPLTVYQTWCTKNLPTKMRETIEFNKSQNPKFNFVLYDDNDCRDFIEKNFDKDVLEAYDALIPGAYKADLWRYCILYVNGGMYLDIKLKCVYGFKFIALTEKEYFPTDITTNEYPNDPNKGVYNAFMVSLPKNEKLLQAINKVVENVKNRYYGISPLDPTGPIMFGDLFDYNTKKNSVVRRYIGTQGNGVSLAGIIILNEYPEYRQEQEKSGKHYGQYWNEKNIYK
jgi:mannosyltransferase OCH1-like enzyme